MTDKVGDQSDRIVPHRGNASRYKWLFLLLLLLSVFIFFSFYAEKFTEATLEIDLDDRRIAVNTKNLAVSPDQTAKLDPEKYFIDTSKGISFRKPESGNWLPPQFLHGVEELLEAKGTVLTQETKLHLMLMLQAHPWGSMLRSVDAIRFATVESLDVEVTADSTNEIAEEFVKNLFASEQVRDLEPSKEDIADARKEMLRQLLGFERVNFSNEFSVLVYDKAKLAGVATRHSLATFAMTVLGPLGLSLDRLVADERSALAGATATIQRAKVNGEIGNFRVDRLWLVTESKSKYYVIEIGFSPQTKSSLKIWDELQSMLKSFSVLE